MSDRIGIGVFGDVADFVSSKTFHQIVVISADTDHFRIKYFNSDQILSAADHIHTGLGGNVRTADEGSGVFRIKGILDTDGNIVQFHRFGSFGMDRLHRHIRELIGNIKVGVTDDTDFVCTDEFGIAGGKMIFLVDDTLFRLSDNSQFAEGDLAVSAVELSHNTFGTLCITGDDGHAACKIKTAHVLEDIFFHTAGVVIFPA